MKALLGGHVRKTVPSTLIHLIVDRNIGRENKIRIGELQDGSKKAHAVERISDLSSPGIRTAPDGLYLSARKVERAPKERV